LKPNVLLILALMAVTAVTAAAPGEDPHSGTPASQPPAAKPAPAPQTMAPLIPVPIPPDTNWVFALIAGSRLYPDWKEAHDVKLGQFFYLGDTPFKAKLTRFTPDFRIENGKTDNWSLDMINPAVRVFVYSDSGAVDSTWAFLNFPPHFSPKSFFTFQLKEVRGYPPKKAGSIPKQKGN